MLEHSLPAFPSLCYLYSHMAHSLVKCAKTILLYNPHDCELNYVWLEYVVFTNHRLIEKKLLPGAKKQIVNNSWWSFQIAAPLTCKKRVAIIHKWKQTHHSCSNAESMCSGGRRPERSGRRRSGGRPDRLRWRSGERKGRRRCRHSGGRRGRRRCRHSGGRRERRSRRRQVLPKEPAGTSAPPSGLVGLSAPPSGLAVLTPPPSRLAGQTGGPGAGRTDRGTCGPGAGRTDRGTGGPGVGHAGHTESPIHFCSTLTSFCSKRLGYIYPLSHASSLGYCIKWSHCLPPQHGQKPSRNTPRFLSSLHPITNAIISTNKSHLATLPDFKLCNTSLLVILQGFTFYLCDGKWTAFILRLYPKRCTVYASHSPVHTHVQSHDWLPCKVPISSSGAIGGVLLTDTSTRPGWDRICTFPRVFSSLVPGSVLYFRVRRSG